MLDLTNNGRSQPPAEAPVARRTPDSVIATENFPVALRILPAATRQHLLALYRYARYVDDLGDEPDPGRGADVDDPVAALDRFAAELRALYDGATPTHPVLVGLAPTIAARGLPADPLLRLIEANRRDQEVLRYPTFDALVGYCHLSADPIGELVLHVFGTASVERIARSDLICTALQVVEHLQDVAEDHRRGRIYLPADDLARFGVGGQDLAAASADGPLRQVIRLQADRAGRLFDTGAPLVGELGGWARVAVAGYLAGGRATLDALRRADYDPLPGPPRPSRLGTAAHWLRTLAVGR